MIFQCFTGRHEVWVWVTDVVEKIGQDGKSDFFFDVGYGISLFHDDHRSSKGCVQLSQAKGDQFEYVGIADGLQLGWVLYF